MWHNPEEPKRISGCSKQSKACQQGESTAFRSNALLAHKVQRHHGGLHSDYHSRLKDAKCEKQEKPCQPDYNQHMGGVDQLTRLINSITTHPIQLSLLSGERKPLLDFQRSVIASALHRKHAKNLGTWAPPSKNMPLHAKATNALHFFPTVLQLKKSAK